jgi:hypothetical protein
MRRGVDDDKVGALHARLLNGGEAVDWGSVSNTATLRPSDMVATASVSERVSLSHPTFFSHHSYDLRAMHVYL